MGRKSIDIEVLDESPENRDRGIRFRFGQRLKRLREENDLTQGQAAEAAGISQASLSKIETSGIAEEELLERLESVYGVRVRYALAPRDPVRRRAYFTT